MRETWCGLRLASSIHSNLCLAPCNAVIYSSLILSSQSNDSNHFIKHLLSNLIAIITYGSHLLGAIGPLLCFVQTVLKPRILTLPSLPLPKRACWTNYEEMDQITWSFSQTYCLFCCQKVPMEWFIAWFCCIPLGTRQCLSTPWLLFLKTQLQIMLELLVHGMSIKKGAYGVWMTQFPFSLFQLFS